jgi:hypothetical protein
MNWNDEDLITVVEELAEEKGIISSEENLSEKFDEMIEELLNGMSYEDGEIHPQQYNDYCYVGDLF